MIEPCRSISSYLNATQQIVSRYVFYACKTRVIDMLKLENMSTNHITGTNLMVKALQTKRLRGVRRSCTDVEPGATQQGGNSHWRGNTQFKLLAGNWVESVER